MGLGLGIDDAVRSQLQACLHGHHTAEVLCMCCRKGIAGVSCDKRHSDDQWTRDADWLPSVFDAGV